MTEQDHHLDTLHDIKQIMERSSRFISLSGLSGIAAGSCALVGAWFAYGVIANSRVEVKSIRSIGTSPEHSISISDWMGNQLVQIALLTFIAAFALSFIFTYIRSRKTNTPIWGHSSRRLLINVMIPMLAGGIYLFKLIENQAFGLIAPGSLIFYGLAVLNASKYTLPETRYLGYAEMLVGIISLWCIGYGIYFWAIGFGVLHIVYGILMWWKYERNG